MSTDLEIPEQLQPNPADVAYDLDDALNAVVGLEAHIPEGTFTAGILGTERAGHGVLVRDSGLVITIGYLVAEAERIWLRTNAGQIVAADLLLYDFESGYGVVQALQPLDIPAIPMGPSTDAPVGSTAIFAGHGGRDGSLRCNVVSKRTFAGYWEYVLDEAIFTTPAHPNWGGAALISEKGTLAGIGSLYVQNARGGDTTAEGNMVVPIDLVNPLIESIDLGRAIDRLPKPWLGVYVAEAGDKLAVIGIAENGPAHRAGVQPGDLVLSVGGAPVGDLPDLFHTIWDVGAAGVKVPLTVWREGETKTLNVQSIDRDDMMRSPRLN